jgi:hypothetical protein
MQILKLMPGVFFLFPTAYCLQTKIGEKRKSSGLPLPQSGSRTGRPEDERFLSFWDWMEAKLEGNDNN